MPFDNEVKSRVVGSNEKYFNSGLATTVFAFLPVGSNMNTIIISNDSSTDTIQYSFNGASIDGILQPKEHITVNVKDVDGIYIKSLNGLSPYRVWGV